jgi:hypothetical protein
VRQYISSMVLAIDAQNYAASSLGIGESMLFSSLDWHLVITLVLETSRQEFPHVADLDTDELYQVQTTKSPQVPKIKASKNKTK